jgi:hypothetical protein
MTYKKAKKSSFSTKLLPAYLLGIAGLFFFVWRGTDPWGWEDLDMATYYVSIEKPGTIINDFFTSCFGDSNGRAIFGLLTAWPIHLGLDWYKTLYLWMLINSVTLPVALYYGLQSSTPGRNNISAAVYFIFIAIAIAYPGKVDQLTVAWWSGWGTFFHPSVFSISLTSFGVFALGSDRIGWKALGSLLAFLSALVHPAYSLGCVIFFTIILGLSGEKLRAITLIGATLLGLFFIKFFSGSGALTVEEYFKFFSWLHPEHYIPSRFVAMGSFPWFAPFLLLNLVLLGSGVALHVMRNKNASLIAFCFFAFYFLAIALQYLFVEKYPLSTTLLLISPARFTAFGYWMGAVCIALFLIQLKGSIYHLPLHYFFPLLRRLQLNSITDQSFKSHRYIFFVSFILISASLSFTGFLHLKMPQDHIDPNKKELFDWILINTNATSEIASNGLMPVEIPLITGRGTYHGNGFPFEDRCLRENYVRYVNIRGVPTGKDGRMNASKFYTDLDISDFKKMNPRPDWVVMDRESPGGVKSMSIQQPSFSNQKFFVFEVDR